MIANNDGWIEWTWTEEKPYPENLETKVVVMFRDGHRCPYSPETVGWWHSGDISANNWYNSGDTSDIVAYRVVN